MTNIKYLGTYLDSSGYGSANRAFITSLWSAGVNVTTELLVQMNEKTNYGLEEQIAKSLQDRDISYKIKILHITPDLYPRYLEAGKYHIGHLFTETDRLPKDWVKPCNMMQEIWTGSDRAIEMMKKSGVTTPIHAFPQPCNVNNGEENIVPFALKIPKTFVFYSVFQWIDRKNPRGLVRAYLKAFSGNDDVSLILKTYRVHYGVDEFDQIKTEVNTWKQELNLPHYPKLFVVPRVLTSKEMIKLHKNGDVYVNASSSEGWNRPLQEAMVMGKPVISADNGGLTDYLTDEHYFKVSSHEKPITIQSHIAWYQEGQHWWEVDEEDLIRTMKKVYEERETIGSTAKKAKEWVVQNTNYLTVGLQLKQRLENIEKFI